jgi:ribulose-phosphate 3-epimerase
MIQIAPSILAADFARLSDEVLTAERAGAQRIHVDVMDGHFVPNLSMGPAVVKSLRPVTRLPLEVHLMVEEPARFVEPFLRAGADRLIFHIEVVADPRALLAAIHDAGKSAAVAVNPEHPVEKLEPFLGEMDLALCMTVHPGFGGQAFLPESPQRIARLRELIERHHPECELEVDGGIELDTAPVAVHSGANVLVAGTAIFGNPLGAAEGIRQLREAASAAERAR